MQTSHHEQTCKHLYKLGQLFNQKIDDEKIEVYADFLQDYSIQQITMSFSNIIKRGDQFFPSLPAIISELNPTIANEDKAQLMADKVFNTALRYGRYQQEAIKADLSLDEMKALQSIGLLSILDSKTSEQPIIKAQLRRTCKAIIEKENVLKKREVLDKIAPSHDGVIDFRTAVQNLINQGDKK